MADNTPTSNLAPFYGPYVSDMLGQAEALANTEFQPYEGDMFAPTSQLYQQAFSGIGQMTLPQYYNKAAQYFNQAATQAGNLGDTYTPQNYKPQTVNPGTMKAASFSGPSAVGYSNVKPQQVEAASFNAPKQVDYRTVTAGQLGPQLDASNFNTVNSFMDPYQRAVTDIAQREANRNYEIQSTQRDAQAVKSGAFGGDRQAILEAEAQRNLNQQLNDLEMQGSSNAYNNAMQALNAQRSANMQAGTTNINAALQAGLANQNAGLQAGTFNANMLYNTGLNNAQLEQQANMANAGYGMQAGLANQNAGLQSGMFNANMLYNTGLNNAQFQQGANQANLNAGLQAGIANQNAGLNAAQLNNQAFQFDSQLNNQGIGQLINAGQGMGNLGNMQAGTQMDIYNQMLGAGGIQQQLAQNPLNFAYQQWQQSQAYPYQNLQFLSQMLQGLPLSVAQTPQNNPWLEAISGAGGVYQLFNQPTVPGVSPVGPPAPAPAPKPAGT